MRLKYLVPAVALFAGLLANTTISFAKKEYTVKEKKPCIFCHTTAAPKDGKNLKPAGEYYEKHKTLKGFSG
ncbi:MAG: hypothetical protein IT160_09245 [Bryobacterales bacterium]|nr:hypothetical protein [Bryobacterales bacterium]